MCNFSLQYSNEFGQVQVKNQSSWSKLIVEAILIKFIVVSFLDLSQIK